MEIKKGDRFRCIKNLYVGGELCFIDGKIYESKFNHCLTDEQGEKGHELTYPCLDDDDYFEKLDPIDDLQQEPTNSLYQGAKNDNGKLKYSLIPPECTQELLKVLEYGLQKYGQRNSWQTIDNPNERYYDALQRHIEAWRMNETTDKESGLNHLSHVLCNAMFLVWFEINKKEDK